MSLERLDHVVSGALFDFGGYLTTREERLIASSADDAAPMADAISEFLRLRGVDPCSPLPCWESRCGNAGGPEISHVKAALDIIRSAMRDDPSYAWVWHCNIAMAIVDEGASQVAGNAAAARFMQLCFGVDTNRPPDTTNKEDGADKP